MTNLLEISIIKNENDVLFEFNGNINNTKYFDFSYPIYYNFPFDISNVPDYVLYSMIISSLLPVIWLLDLKVHCKTLDKNFYYSIEEIKKTYKNMLYKTKYLKGKILVDELIESNYPDTGSSAVLFSGGVDAYTTCINHIDEKPDLITIIGADFDCESGAYNKILSKSIDFTSIYGGKSMFVKTDLRRHVNESVLDEICLVLFRDTWWHALMHSLFVISPTFVFSYVYRYSNIYIASSYTKDIKLVCASSPQTDQAIKFGLTTIIHDGYRLDRVDKISVIYNFKEKTKLDIRPNVCFSQENSNNDGENCCYCEKCMRTIYECLVNGIDPKKMNFNRYVYSYDQVKKIYNKKDIDFVKIYHLKKVKMHMKTGNLSIIPNDLKWLNSTYFIKLSIIAMIKNSFIYRKYKKLRGDSDEFYDFKNKKSN